MVVLGPEYQVGTFNRTYVRIEVDGREVVYHHGCNVSFSFEQSVAEADFEVPFNYPPWMGKWSSVKIVIGSNISSAKPRFFGFVMGMEPKLWPPSMVVKCRGMLVKAVYGFPPTSFGVNLGEGTDQQIISMVLTRCGVPSSMLDIQGAGKVLGTDMGLGDFGDFIDPGVDLPDVPEGYIWSASQSGIALIQSIEQVTLGYRTHDTPSGVVSRRRYSTVPYATAKYSFYQGVNILDGSMSFKIKEPVDSVTIINRDGSITTYPPIVDDGTMKSGDTISSQWIIDDPTAGLDPVEVINWRLQQAGWTFISVSFSTHEDVDLRPGDTIYCESTWMRCNQNFYAQSVRLTVDEVGLFTQTLTLVSELGLGSYNPGVGSPGAPGNPNPSAPAVPPVPTLQPTPLAAESTSVQFQVSLLKEVVEVDGEGVELYDVMCESTASDPTLIVNDSETTWLADGPGVVVESGVGPIFTTAFTSLTGASITMTANSVPATRDLSEGAAVPIHIMKMYSHTEDTFWAFDGLEWRSGVPEGGGVVRCVGNGPYWGVGNRVYWSEDDLATETSYSEPLPSGENVTALWVADGPPGSDVPPPPGDPEVPQTDVATVWVGGDRGSIRYSSDGGRNWETRFPQHRMGRHPDVWNIIRFIYVDPRNPQNVLVASLDGWFMSTTGATEFEPEDDRQAGGPHEGYYVHVEIGPSRSIGVSGPAPEGVPGVPVERRLNALYGQFNSGLPSSIQSFTIDDVIVEGVVAATAHIRDDRFFAADNVGNTYYQLPADEGTTAMTLGTPVPEGGIPAEGGMTHDETIVDLVYVAADNGIWKSIDGLRTAEGWRKLLSAPT